MEDSGPSTDFDAESYPHGAVSVCVGSNEKVSSNLERKTELKQKEGCTLHSETHSRDDLSARNNDTEKRTEEVRFCVFHPSKIGVDSTSSRRETLHGDYNDALH